MASLFSTQLPDNSFDDGSPGITTATSMVFAEAGTITHVRFYAANFTLSGTFTVAVWEVTANDSGGGGTGTLLESKAVDAATLTQNTWNDVALDSAVTVTADTVLYRIGVHSAQWYVAANTFFASPLTNGDITGPANSSDPVGLGTLRQGSFSINAALTYPTNVGSSASYFVDVIFEVGVALDPVTPTGLSIPLALGSPTVALNRTAAPTGLAVPAALGEPTVSLNRTAAPTGLAVPVTFGTPVVGTAVTPDALLIDVEFGTPTVGATVSSEVVGNWWGLKAVVDEARQMKREDDEELRNPVSCPNDGEPLLTGARGQLYCPYDGWRP